jgi:hypothetical protein
MASIDASELSPFFYPSDSLGDVSDEDLGIPSLVVSPLPHRIAKTTVVSLPAIVAQSPANAAPSPAIVASSSAIITPPPAIVAHSPPRLYSQVVANSPIQPSLSRKSSSISSMSSINSIPRKEASVRRVAERIHGVKLVHVLGLPYKKIGQLRRHMETLKFHVQDIINMSFLSNRVVECLVRQRGYKAFRKTIRLNGLSAFEEYDPSSAKDNTLIAFLDESIRTMSSKQILVEFVKRIARESNMTRDPVAKEFFASWAAGLNMSKEFYSIAKENEQDSSKVNSWRQSLTHRPLDTRRPSPSFLLFVDDPCRISEH